MFVSDSRQFQYILPLTRRPCRVRLLKTCTIPKHDRTIHRRVTVRTKSGQFSNNKTLPSETRKQYTTEDSSFPCITTVQLEKFKIQLFCIANQEVKMGGRYTFHVGRTTDCIFSTQISIFSQNSCTTHLSFFHGRPIPNTITGLIG